MLKADRLCMHYDDTVALNNLSFTVHPREIFCLLGQNGAGKTTTINIFSGLIEPTSGKALIDGVSAEKKSARQSIAYIPEEAQLYGHLSGLENLNFFSRLTGFIYTEEGLKGLLKKVNLQETVHQKRLVTYSKEMRLKLGIAMALAKKASYILMDEPTSDLGPKASLEFTELCKELSVDNVGILMATDDIFNAVIIGSKIGIMKKGWLVQTVDTSKISVQELQDLYSKTNN